jgi:hypothetical protein
MRTETALVSERADNRVALGEPDGRWELDGGVLREKPRMSVDHHRLAFRLAFVLQPQLDWTDLVGQDGSRVRRSERHVCIPDVFVAQLPRRVSPSQERSA